MYNKWFANVPVSDGRLNLLCFPFAGGGSTAFSSWRRQLPDWINVCPIVLPGRESRHHEPLQRDFSMLVQNLTELILPAMENGPCALYGHSMGAWLAHDTARCAQALTGMTPTCLCISAQRAPHIPYPFPSCSTMDDAQLLTFLRAFGGFDTALLENTEWLEWILPILRADLCLCESHAVVAPDEMLDCPIYTFGGRNDRLIDETLLKAWQSHTKHCLEVNLFDGGHFFIRTESVPFLSALVCKLSQHHFPIQSFA